MFPVLGEYLPLLMPSHTGYVTEKSVEFCYVKSMQLLSLKSMRNTKPGLILGLHPANERRRYFVTTSHIGWVQV